MNDRSLGVASLIVALAILMFIVLFGIAAATGLSQSGGAAGVLTFFHEHVPLNAALFLNSIVMHLAVVALAVGLYIRVGGNVAFATIGAILGISWGILDIAQSSVTYNAAISAPTADATTIDTVAKGLQNAAHLGGGLWVLSLVTVVGLGLSRAHRTVGLMVGSVFALHALVVPLVPAWWALEYIGIPLWFGWTAVVFLRRGAVVERTVPMPAVSAG